MTLVYLENVFVVLFLVDVFSGSQGSQVMNFGKTTLPRPGRPQQGEHRLVLDVAERRGLRLRFSSQREIAIERMLCF